MSARRFLSMLTAAAVLAASGIGLYFLGTHRGMSLVKAHASVPASAHPGDPSTWGIAQGEQATRRHIQAGLKAGALDPETGRVILYYHDPMVPGRKFDAPGKSPYMDMMLVPAYGGADTADTGTIRISARTEQNLGLRTAEVREGELAPVVQAVGTIAWNEREQVTVQARAAGYVEKLHVRATLDTVTRGQALADLYVPAWVAAQEDYLAVRRMRAGDAAELVDAARQRMRQAGMDDAQIRLVERRGQVVARTTLRAPMGGVLLELVAREGMTVLPGTTLARIGVLDPIWVHAEVPESQAALLAAGGQAIARTAALPAERFEGRLEALLPVVDPATRTRTARVQLANPEGRLVPGMSVRVQMHAAQPRTTLLVPSEAVIHTGLRDLVMVAEDGGRFRPVEVQTGMEVDGKVAIVRGLQAGQRVVLSGQFLLDSEAGLAGVEVQTLDGASAPVPGASAPPAADAQRAYADGQTHRAHARVEALAGDTVTLSHGPVPSLDWPSMTMDFRLAPALRDAALVPGQAVVIDFRMQTGDLPRIVAIEAATDAPEGVR
jgi:Cu(I)/Ag(I) efflux system membrane fusion protein